MRLLQSTWAELLTLTLAFRSMEQCDHQGGDGSGDIDSVGGVVEENYGNGLKLRYASDYWLDERLARDCDLGTFGASSSSNGNTSTSTTSSSITIGAAVVAESSVLDIYNLVSNHSTFFYSFYYTMTKIFIFCKR